MNKLGNIICRTFARRATKSPNPGMKRRIKLETVTDSTLDTFEEAESDFFQVHKMHRQFGNETEEHKEMIKSLIVKNKYFKVKFPNLLTWSEKEQIRFLHNNDKEEWTVEALADSFPADIFTIKKIIKSKWTPTDQTRMAKHDNLVNKNWELLKAGKLDLDPDLLEHLQKFSNRKLHQLPESNVQSKHAVDLFKPTSTEFASIVQSSKSTKKPGRPNKMLPSKEDKMEWRPPKKDMFVLSDIENRKPVTYRQLGLSDTTDPEQPKPQTLTGKNESIFPKLELTQNVNNSSFMAKVEEVDLKPLCRPAIRENIKIPKKHWKRGATYKIDDCYYDDDGEFLYRVPGMK